MSWRDKCNEEQPGRSDEDVEEGQQSLGQTTQTQWTTGTESTNESTVEAEVETVRRLSELTIADVNKPTSKKLIGLRNRIEDVGTSILEKICHHAENFVRVRATMIPPIPNSTFIDKFPDGMTLEGLNLAEKELQDGYEAEVKLYRRLEDLQEAVLVLHGLEYTHEQCSAFLLKHLCSNMNCSKDVKLHSCHKSTKELEGECDFVLIGNNYVALFEVKGVHFSDESDPNNALRFHGSCKDAMRQIERIKEFIKAVNDDVQIFEFIVFSNLTIKECLPFTGEENRYSETILDCMVFSDDLGSFNSWFDSKVTQKLSRIELDLCVLKVILLGLWCIDIDNRYDIASCSLNKCVLDINDKLKRALVTRRAVDEDRMKQKANSGKQRKHKKSKNKKHPSNPRITDAPELLRTHLNIECLSKQQEEILHCDDRFVWIDGSAGSGKTIIMLGKILQLALSTKKRKNKIIIMVPDFMGSSAACYRSYGRLLNVVTSGLCGVMYLDLWSRKEPELDIKRRALMIKNSSATVVLLNSCFPGVSPKLSLDVIGIIRELCNVGVSCSVFFNDFQIGWSGLNGNIQGPTTDPFHYIEQAITILQNLVNDNDCSVWIASDIVQQIQQWLFGSFSKLFSLINAQMKVLSTNFRNSREISDILHVVRRKYLKCSQVNDVGTSIAKEVDSGHFIRGTKPKLFIVKSDGSEVEGDTLKILFKDELLKVTNKDFSVFKAPEIAILCQLHQEHHKDTLINVLNEAGFWQPDEVNAMIRDPYACHSAEWPVVIALLRVRIFTGAGFFQDWIDFLTVLYLTMSRATVHFSAFIHVSGTEDQDFKGLLSQIDLVSPGTVNFVTDDLQIVPMSELSNLLTYEANRSTLSS